MRARSFRRPFRARLLPPDKDGCFFGHEEPRGTTPLWSRFDVLEEDVHILRQAVRKVSAVLMWRNGKQVEQVCPVDNVPRVWTRISRMILRLLDDESEVL